MCYTYNIIYYIKHILYTLNSYYIIYYYYSKYVSARKRDPWHTNAPVITCNTQKIHDLLMYITGCTGGSPCSFLVRGNMYDGRTGAKIPTRNTCFKQAPLTLPT